MAASPARRVHRAARAATVTEDASRGDGSRGAPYASRRGYGTPGHSFPDTARGFQSHARRSLIIAERGALARGLGLGRRKAGAKGRVIRVPRPPAALGGYRRSDSRRHGRFAAPSRQRSSPVAPAQNRLAAGGRSPVSQWHSLIPTNHPAQRCTVPTRPPKPWRRQRLHTNQIHAGRAEEPRRVAACGLDKTAKAARRVLGQASQKRWIMIDRRIRFKLFR